ncbi:Sec-independent protein translocase protein TatB [Roseibium suaedae]|uniref:Sec-independent protein translocase protein TatB n=1 Tax=Roseibium suaedae TaxID=735517 RepID=A0A1M7L1G7_9HYPH|nr:Sec-independent protein translocase protein TatB [Roseibium suaedae]SHM71715.1 sec-independent protein translocase protein TatB [Roseibium suaedae]
MFDIGWTEIMVIVCVAIIVVGPKDLPRMLRTVGQMIGKARRLSREFQSTFNEAIREAEQQAGIDEMRKQVEAAGNTNPLGDLKKSIEAEQSAKAAKPVAPEAVPPVPMATAPAADQVADPVPVEAASVPSEPAVPASAKTAATVAPEGSKA